LALASGITLLLRRGAGEASFLVTSAPGEPTAIFLDGQYRFSYMPSAGNDDWTGVLVPNVAIEIDETSILDASEGQPLEVLVRKHTRLSIRAQRDPHRSVSTIAIVADPLRATQTNPPPSRVGKLLSASGYQSAFSKHSMLARRRRPDLRTGHQPSVRYHAAYSMFW
jgi:hypothetical protein